MTKVVGLILACLVAGGVVYDGNSSPAGGRSPQIAPCQPPSDADWDGLVETTLTRSQTEICRRKPCRPLGLIVGIATAAGDRIRSAGLPTDPIRRPTSTVEVASLTKLMTSALVLMLAGEGRLLLDHPIGEYLPKKLHGIDSPFLSGPYSGITVRELLTHTSGLPWEPADLYGRQSRGHALRQKYGVEDLYRDLHGAPPEAPMGTRFIYSSYGFSVLTALVEWIERKPFAQSLRERITAPLGMASTTVEKTGLRLIPAYTEFAELNWSQIRYLGSETLFDGAGGVKSTMRDMLRFARAEAGLLPDVPSGLRTAMLQTQEVQCAIDDAAGAAEAGVDCGPARIWHKTNAAKQIAMDWQAKSGGTRLSHAGGVPGFKSYLVVDRSAPQPIAAVVFTNTERADSDVIFSIADGLISLHRGCHEVRTSH